MKQAYLAAGSTSIVIFFFAQQRHRKVLFSDAVSMHLSLNFFPFDFSQPLDQEIRWLQPKHLYNA